MSRPIVFQQNARFFGTNVRVTPTAGHNSVVRTAIMAICCVMLSMTALAQTTTYVQTNIISDVAGTASVTDPTLINPWGVSVGPAIWIDAAGSGLVKVDTSAGATVMPNVTIPAASEASANGSPSGTVYNSAGTGFNLPDGASALFLFGTLDGTIAAWNAGSGTQAVMVVNNSSEKAAYTGIALDTNATGTFLLAADFALGTVDVFNSSFAPAKLAGSFTDPYLPAGFSPFDIHSIGGILYVTYAGFGSFGGDLLVGNFGDGTINAFNPTTFAFVGTLSTAAGTSITNPGLWEIFFGQGGTLGDPNTLYFSAGINKGQDGLFGSIGMVQPAAGAPSFTLSATATSLTVGAAQPGSIMVSLAATNGFSGPVTLSCTSTTVTCTFNQTTVTLSGSSATTIGVSVAESAPAAPAPTPAPPSSGYVRSMAQYPARLFHSPTGLTLSFIGPVGLLTFAGLKRRTVLARGSLFALLLLGTVAGIAGCSSSQQSPASMAATPDTSNLTITATSGTITQSVTIAVTEQ
jgi:hypothetical protein